MSFGSSENNLNSEARLRLGRNSALTLYVSGGAAGTALFGKELLDSGVDLLGFGANAADGVASGVEDALNVPAWVMGVGGGFVGMAVWAAIAWMLIYWRWGSRRGPKVGQRFF